MRPQQGLPGAGFDSGRIAAQVNLLADFDGLYVKSRAGRLQNLERGVHDFRSDAVAVGDRDGSLNGHKGNNHDKRMREPAQLWALGFSTNCEFRAAPRGRAGVGQSPTWASSSHMRRALNLRMAREN